jgi:hypothetical protein
LKQW